MILLREYGGPPPNSTSDTGSVPLFNHRAGAYGLTITFSILAWFCSVFRLYTRAFVLRSLWWDDFFIVFVLISTTFGSIIFCIMHDHGLGSKHMDDMTVPELTEFFKLFYMGSITYPLSLTLIKLAVLFQYLRIFEKESRRRTWSKGLIYFTFVWGLFYTFPTWVPCAPVSAMWDVTAPVRHCWAFGSPDISEMLGFYISHSITTTLLDLIIFLLPVDLFFKSDTSKTSRISLVCLFILGLIVNLCSIGRLIYSLRPSLDALWDLSWNSSTPTGLATIEINLATVCAALPIFWPVLKEQWGRIVVTYEVKITSEHGIFVPRGGSDKDWAAAALPGSASSDRELATYKSEAFKPTEWDPYIRHTKTAMGDLETRVESGAENTAKGPQNGTSFLL